MGLVFVESRAQSESSSVNTKTGGLAKKSLLGGQF
jgi:hypothetical protein